jgi:hypothetical protein
MSGPTTQEYYEALRMYLPDDARLLIHTRPRDPEKWAAKDGRKMGWWPRVMNNHAMLDEPALNVYAVVSGFRAGAEKNYRRTKENFGGGLLLMIDDVGDAVGGSTKVPRAVLEKLPPTALVETSPGNHQAQYFFSEPVPDADKFEAVINAFIKQKLTTDSGMAGINRYFRPPFGINGKEKYGGAFEVNCREWHPHNRYTMDEVVKAFGLKLEAARPRVSVARQQDNAWMFAAVESYLTAFGMAHQHKAFSGKLNITCPWVHDHSDGRDDGAALWPASAANRAHIGVFKCQHGHCEGRDWNALLDWIVVDCEDFLNSINTRAAASDAAWIGETK